MAKKESKAPSSRAYSGGEYARPGPPEGAGSLPEIVRIAAWRRWHFLITAGIATAVALASSLFWPRKYTAHCVIERQDDVALSNIVSSQSPFGFHTYRLALPVELKGLDAVRDAIEAIGMSRGLPRDAQGALTVDGQHRLQQLAELVMEDVELSFIEKSDRLDLIQVTFTWSDPGIAQQLVTKLKDNYIQRTRNQILENMQKAQNFFAHETDIRRKKLQDAEMNLDRIKAEVGGDPTSEGFLEERRNELEAERKRLLEKKRDLDRQLSSASTTLQGLNDRLRAGTTSQPATTTGPADTNAPINAQDALNIVNDLRREVRQTEDDISNLKVLRNMKDEHPDVVALKTKLVRKREQLAQAEAQLPTSSAPGVQATPENLPTMQMEATRLENNITLLRELQSDVVADLQNVDRLLAEWEAKKSDLFDALQRYKVHLKEYDQAVKDHAQWEGWRDQVARFLAAEWSQRGIQLSTKEEAQPVLQPSSPKFLMVLIVCLAVGAALGAGMVVLAEFVDRSYRTSVQVTRSLGLPVLETIDEILTPQLKFRQFLRRAVLMPSVSIVLLVMVAATAGAAYLSLEMPQIYQMARSSPKSAAGELLRILGLQ